MEISRFYKIEDKYIQGMLLNRDRKNCHFKKGPVDTISWWSFYWRSSESCYFISRMPCFFHEIDKIHEYLMNLRGLEWGCSCGTSSASTTIPRGWTVGVHSSFFFYMRCLSLILKTKLSRKMWGWNFIYFRGLFVRDFVYHSRTVTKVWLADTRRYGIAYS